MKLIWLGPFFSLFLIWSNDIYIYLYFRRFGFIISISLFKIYKFRKLFLIQCNLWIFSSYPTQRSGNFYLVLLGLIRSESEERGTVGLTLPYHLGDIMLYWRSMKPTFYYTTKTFMQSLLFETTFTRKQKQKEEGQVAGLL